MSAVIRPAVLSPVAPSPSRLQDGVRATQAWLTLWQRRAETRAALRRLDPSRLEDVGLSRADAAYEGAKPFWRA